MSKITQVTGYKVEGFSQTFDTQQEAEKALKALKTRDLSDFLEKNSDITEDEAWDLASLLRSNYALVPRDKKPEQLLKEFTETTQLYMNPESVMLVEHIQNAY